MKDYYKILGVKESASEEEIRARWIKLVRKLHPDRVGEESADSERIREINEAYDILKDSSARFKYDLKRTYDRKKRRSHTLKWAVPTSLVIVPVILGSIYLYVKMPKSSFPSKGVGENGTKQTDQMNQQDQTQSPSVGKKTSPPSPVDKTLAALEPQPSHKIAHKIATMLSKEASRETPKEASQKTSREVIRETPKEVGKETPKEAGDQTTKEVKKRIPKEKVKVLPPVIETPLESPVRAEGEFRPKEEESPQAVLKSEMRVEIAKVDSPSPPREELDQRQKPPTQAIPKSEISVPAERVVLKEASQAAPQEMTRSAPQADPKRPEVSSASPPRESTDGAVPKRIDPGEAKAAIDSKRQMAERRIDPTDAKTPSMPLPQRSNRPSEHISAKSSMAGEEEVRQFFAKYVERYIQKDLDGFLSFFSSKAVQNQKEGWNEIRKIYANFFNRTQQLQYELEDLKIEIYQNAIQAKARYEVGQTLKKTGERKVWRGPIRWALVKENGTLKIISIDYLFQKGP